MNKPMISYDVVKNGHQRGDLDRYATLKAAVDKRGGLTQTPPDMAFVLDHDHARVIKTAFDQAWTSKPFVAPAPLFPPGAIDQAERDRQVAEAEFIHFVAAMTRRGQKLEGMMFAFALAGDATVDRVFELERMCKDRLAPEFKRGPFPQQTAAPKGGPDVDGIEWSMMQ